MLDVGYTVDVAAPPERIWQAMADVERWPEFAPQFKSIVRTDEGPLALGKTARVTPHGFWGAVWTVIEFEAPRSFTWEAGILPGIHLVAGHIVQPKGEGADVTLSLQASGPMWFLLAPVLSRIFHRNVRQEGDGLKAYCEGGSP